MTAHKKKCKKFQPTSSSSYRASKSCRKPVSNLQKNDSKVAYNVDATDSPTPRGADGRYDASSSEVAILHGAVEVRGNWDDPKGCFVIAKRDIGKNEIFTTTRTRFCLRKKGEGAANPWQIKAPFKTAEAICIQMRKEQGKLGKKEAAKWTLDGYDMFVGPPRAGKSAGNAYIYTEMSPPEDRGGEVIYRINSVEGDMMPGGEDGSKSNVMIKMCLARPRKEKEGIQFAVPQIQVITTKSIKKGEELLADYDYRFLFE